MNNKTPTNYLKRFNSLAFSNLNLNPKHVIKLKNLNQTLLKVSLSTF